MINVLIPFNVLIDTDIGILEYINREFDDTYYNSDIPNLSFIERINIIRKNISKNPLDIIFFNKTETDDYYKEIMENNYHEVLNYSSYTAMVSFVKMCIDREGEINIGIFCKNDIEVSYTKELMSDCLPTFYNIIQGYDSIDWKKYGIIYLKYIEDIYEMDLLDILKKIDGKVLYISDYRYNLNEERYKKGEYIPKEEFILPLSFNNEIKLFTLYNYEPEVEEDDYEE